MHVVQFQRFAMAAGAALILAACGGGHATVVPARPGSTNAPGGGSPGTSMSSAQIAAALQSVQTYYQTLPHAAVSADLQQLAAHMTASGTFATATVASGGITATFSDGSPAAVFADKPEDLGGTYDLARARAASGSRAPRSWSAGNSHEIAFLVDEEDTGFNVAVQTAFANAFTAAGFTGAAGYGVDVQDVTLENIVTLGGYGVDFLDINTHGMIPFQGVTLFFSTTPVSDAAKAQYQNDITARNLVPSTVLGVAQTATYAFTTDFLKNRLRFNPGSIVDVQACWGANPGGNTATTLQSAGAGRFIGWTRSVLAGDSYATEGFLFDRLLGEQSPSATGLDRYAAQRTPPQRPFALDAIETAMQTELRSGPESTAGSSRYTYAQSFADATNPALLVVNDFGGESAVNPPIEYGLPSIQRVVVDEISGALDIVGSFPATSGTVTFTGAQGATALTPSSWKTNAIVAPLPSGNGSGGLVTVTAQGITSNAVPLTAWTGQIVFSAHGSAYQWDDDSGTGTFTLGGTFNVTLRADVHPYVPAIDASPIPQGFAVSAAAPGSNGALTSGSGSFTSDASPDNACKGCSIALALVNPQPTMVPSATSPNQFFVVNEGATAPVPPFPVPSPAPGCSTAQTGPNADANTMCGFLYFTVNDPVSCTVAAGSPPYCGDIGGALSDAMQSLGGPTVYFVPSFTLTMDPSTYALTLASSPVTYAFDPFGTPGSGSTALSGSFHVQSAPTGATPAGRRRL